MPVEKADSLDHTSSQLHAIYDSAPVGLYLLDRDLRYVALNRRLAEIDEVPDADHIGKSPQEIAPDLFEPTLPHMLRALTGEAAFGVEVEKPSNGINSARQVFLCSVQPVRNPDQPGDVVGVCGAVMDVSEYKRAENALRQSEEHLRHMIRLSPHTAWVLNTRGEVVEASPQWEDVTGQPISEALGDGWKRKLHPDDRAHTDRAIADAVNHGNPIDIIYRVLTPAGHWQPMRARGAARHGPSGKVMCVYGVVEVIEAQKPPAPEVRDCVAELRATLDIIPYGIIIADATDGSIFMVNSSAQSILRGAAFPGQRLNEYSAWHVVDAQGALVPAWDYPLAKAIVGGECTEPQRFYLEAADGTRTPLFLSAKPIHSDTGQLVAAIMIIRTTSPRV